MQHGGYRLGAGRKVGFAAKSAEEARKLLAEKVAQEIGPISSALISKAKKGDIPAIKELFDRAWGKPSQSIAVEDMPRHVTAINIVPVDVERLKRVKMENLPSS